MTDRDRHCPRDYVSRRSALVRLRSAVMMRMAVRLARGMRMAVLVDEVGKGKVYRKTREDRLLGITRVLEKQRAGSAKSNGTAVKATPAGARARSATSSTARLQ